MAHQTCTDEIVPAPPRRVLVAQLMAYAVAWVVFLWGELAANPPVRAEWLDRLLAAEGDSLTWLLVLVLAPLAWRRRFAARSKAGRCWEALWGNVAAAHRGWFLGGIIWSLIIGSVSLSASAYVGRTFDNLPPAYHDEYSYLFQAETFLAGRTSYPSHEAARLFDQVHVLNEGRFASRYFPGAGLWLAPFVAWGHPWWGHWLAGAICSVLFFWTGRELAGDACGVLAGLLTALSPGMALFSNLLLAHHPTLVGLGLFLLGYMRCLRSARAAWAVVAGAGLAFAALCRPMTAAGVALPFGVDFLVWTLRGAKPISHDGLSDAALSWSHRLGLILAMGVPLLAGGAAMFAYDRAITGNGWTTPYGLYTEIYTPRHVYGFNNGVRGDSRQGPRVIEKYDRWAENLTLPLAAKNTEKRWMASWTWTLGIIPLAMALTAGLCCWPSLPTGARLILAGILSLHAAHVPYWFVGMFDHHYVFEAGPLWCLWTGTVTVCAARAWYTERRWLAPAWWSMALVAAVAINYSGMTTWSAPLAGGISQVRFAREKYGRFRSRIASEVRERRALVLVEEDPADVHIDYVTNSPDLKGEIIFGRYLPETVPMNEIERLFPDRSIYLYRARSDTVTRLR